MRGRQLQRAIADLAGLPVLSLPVSRLLMLRPREGRELADLLADNAVLAKRTLQLTGLAHGGADVEAVRHLATGPDAEVIGMGVLAVGLVDAFRPSAERGEFDRHAFWQHAMGVASAAELLAEPLEGCDARLALLAGLAHDVGKVILATLDPVGYGRVLTAVEQGEPISDAERRHFDLDHTDVGRRVLERWHMPDAWAEVAWLHHLPAASLDDLSQDRTLVRVVHAADAVCRSVGIGFSGTPLAPGVDIQSVADLGISPEAHRRIVEDLPARVHERVTLLGLDGAAGDIDYVGYMEAANAELNRASRRLRRENKSLEARVRRHRHLLNVASCVRPNMDLAHALAAVAASWRDALRARRVLCYAFPANGDAIGEDVEVAVSPTAGDEQGHLPVAIDGGEPEAGLTSRLLPILGTEPSCILPMDVGGRRVGAIWAATDDVFGADELADLGAMAAACGLAVERVRYETRWRQRAEDLAHANRRLEETHQRLQRTRQLAALGELSAGAAHEMNNPLAVISGRAQLLLAGETDSDKEKALVTIARQADRVSRIVTDLMNFARPPEPDFQTTHISHVARAGVDERRDMAAERQIELVEALDDSLPTISADAAQIQDVVVQLVTNAIEAIGREGRIEVATRAAESGKGVEMLVADDGPGVPAGRVAHIFDPFYSGRDAGRGRGLGLSKAFRIAEQHGGELVLKTTGPERTAFLLRLPWAAASPPT